MIYIYFPDTTIKYKNQMEEDNYSKTNEITFFRVSSTSKLVISLIQLLSINLSIFRNV